MPADDRSSAGVHRRRTTDRRRVLRGVFAAALGLVSAPILVASRSAGAEEARFDETYRGRSIVGVRSGGRRFGNGGSGAWHVTVDGRQLHLMRRVDGGWMSMVDHYQSYATPLAAARAAVDELGLVARPGAPGDRSGRREDGRMPSGAREAEREHRHGVHP
ncbi:tyrosinase family oxidase copper chaperone [Streptomyces sp. V4I2]|uniref:tyrosinase family oxidase copper chaperone n=1 Tax=Streptomyces sp. V4I2 TaxID=3042280 RepID=UPI0027D87EF8|nr:tyrosinase family oxidase copper chaperone [Streptomyces sp. V4I2]